MKDLDNLKDILNDDEHQQLLNRRDYFGEVLQKLTL
jgi:hypothetical protein